MCVVRIVRYDFDASTIGFVTYICVLDNTKAFLADSSPIPAQYSTAIKTIKYREIFASSAPADGIISERQLHAQTTRRLALTTTFVGSIKLANIHVMQYFTVPTDIHRSPLFSPKFSLILILL